MAREKQLGIDSIDQHKGFKNNESAFGSRYLSGRNSNESIERYENKGE